jgi:hypothetical protein
MRVKGEKHNEDYTFDVDLCPAALCGLIAFGFACTVLIVVSQSWLAPGGSTKIEVPGKGTLETSPRQADARPPAATMPVPAPTPKTTEPSFTTPPASTPSSSTPPSATIPVLAPAPTAAETDVADLADGVPEFQLQPSLRAQISPVPLPRSRPYGYFYVGLYREGDGNSDYVYVAVPCALNRPLPRACFMPPEVRIKFPVRRKY